MQIEPTVGRVMHYREWLSQTGEHSQPLAAMVAWVSLDDGNIEDSFWRVNLSVLRPDGSRMAVQRVRVVQDGEDPPDTKYAHWMDYQVGQASKTEAVGALTARIDATQANLAELSSQVAGHYVQLENLRESVKITANGDRS